MQQTKIAHNNLCLAAFWAVLGAFGTLAGFPYLLSLNQPTTPPPLPLPILAILSAGQSGILLFLLSWLGLRLGQPLGLNIPFARAFVNGEKFPPVSKSALNFALISGIGGGLMILVLARLFQPFLPRTEQATTLDIDLWKRFLASFYGGITEELLLRLFLMTLIVWVLWKLGLRAGEQPSEGAFWGAITLSALLFGVGHLPAAAAVWTLTPIVIARTLILNSMMGIAFGFLYWQWGLEYAMLSHFCADVVLHVIGGS
jgi:membrane protease YdiL (CAAX protease family)